MLKKVILIARHGPREPILILPKLKKFQSDRSDPTMSAQLTDKGRNYCKMFGERVRKTYAGKLELNKKNIYLCSSNVDRTIESTKYFMKGFSNSNMDFEIKRDKILMGTIRLDDEQKKYMSRCSKINNHNTSLDKKINDVLGFKVLSSNHYFDIDSSIKCYQYEGIRLPKELDKCTLDEIENAATIYYNKLFSNGNLIKLFTKPLFELIATIVNNNNIKFAYLSTHDVVIFPLALRLTRIFKKDRNLIKIPDFCSYVIYEMYEDHTKVFYDDKLIVDFKLT